ncbi:histidine kinase [Schinkia azotoformans MEV2011]|uniref:histidine kinase n=1 Tax=Schinkia azotoformans MEV2011 TaxID=1348973 RepID=A0A072P0Z6_SCHAZ|nr:ATP-binding protein [Schinkia azotoformans]KEF39160.1 histidine kinase [Schinkia azotoformans MEV2011]
MKNKLFNHTQWRLTLLFTSFLIIFLISFILITYFSLLSIVTNDQKEKAIALVNEEMEDHREDLFEWYFEGKRKKHSKRDVLEYKPEARTFYFVISSDGILIDGDENKPEIRSEILSHIKNWQPEENEVKRISIHLEDGSKEDLLLSGRPIFEHGSYLGTIYAGTNISEETEVIQTLLFILIVLSIIFIAASALLGYWMAGRAMVPISNAFNRQKEFTADASHELRTPLSILQSSLEVIEAEDRENLSPFSVTVLDDLKDEVKRMTHLVNDLLLLARTDLGKEQINKDWFSITSVLEKLQRKFQYEAEKAGVHLSASLENEVKVFGDEEKITQLLFILVDNAIKYNVPGGDVQVSAVKDNNQIRIEVKDTGVGIPLEHQKRIFDRFYRVDQARSREKGSSGIGLSIADWIVQVHNGKLEVISGEEGKGTIFSILLPLTK